jgi:nudix motif 8
MASPIPTIDFIRKKMSAPVLAQSLKRLLQHSNYTFPTYNPPTTRSDAAVLVPFCHLNNDPAILFTLRSTQLSTHQGEISFPGGKFDAQLDASLLDCATRETWEEIGIEPNSLMHIGSNPPIPEKSGTIRVHSYVAVVDMDPLTQCVSDPSLRINRDEVEAVFALTLDQLIVQRQYRKQVKFRGTGMLVWEWTIPEISRVAPGTRIWGLTAFILEHTLYTLFGPQVLHSNVWSKL